MNMMSEQVNELFAAMAKAQATIQPALKDKANPFFKSRYCDLASVWSACRDSLSSNGICVVQTVDKNESGMFLITTLGHMSGQWMRSQMPILLGKMDPQSLGSAITYCRRYSLAAIVGVAPDDDDDGERAQQTYRKQEAQNQELPKPLPISKEMVQELVDLESQVSQECREKSKKFMQEKCGTGDFLRLNQDQYRIVKYGFTANIKQ